MLTIRVLSVITTHHQRPRHTQAALCDLSSTVLSSAEDNHVFVQERTASRRPVSVCEGERPANIHSLMTTGPRNSKRVGAALGTWQTPVIYPTLRTHTHVPKWTKCCSVTLQPIGEYIGNSVERVHHIAMQVLGYRKVQHCGCRRVWRTKSRQHTRESAWNICCGIKRERRFFGSFCRWGLVLVFVL